MTTLIIGLGNPGPEYAKTRHNIGFLALDRLREVFAAPEFQSDQKFFSQTSSILQSGSKVILAKPETFMNESGRAVQTLLGYYKLDTKSLIVIHDELDLAPGVLRTTESSRSAGHNGVQNIIDTLGTQDFYRLRLGIGRPIETEGNCIPSHDYVLGRFSEEESAALGPLLDAAIKAVQERLSI